jgi:hypothetical protein
VTTLSAEDQELRDILETLKKKVRRVSSLSHLPSCASDLLKLMQARLTRHNQRFFYHTLEVVGHTATSSLNFYIARASIPLFEYATLTRADCFSPGYLRELRAILLKLRETGLPSDRDVTVAVPTTTTIATVATATAAASATASTSAGRMHSLVGNAGRLVAAADRTLKASTASAAVAAAALLPPPPPPSSSSFSSAARLQQQAPPQQQQQQQQQAQRAPITVTSKAKRSFAMTRYPFKCWDDGFLMQPVRLNHADGNGTFSFPFVVSEAEFASLRAAMADVVVGGGGGGGGGNGAARLQVRVVLLTDECQGLYSVTVPRDGLQMFVNDQPLVLLEYNSIDPCDRFYGTDVTSAVQVGLNSFKVTIDKCCCIYRFAVRLVHEKTDAALVQAVLDKHRLQAADEAYEAARGRLVASFVSNNDAVLQETAIRASLRDPVTLVRLCIPARGALCQHAQCFDLLSYLSFQRTDVRFLCPVCQQRVLYEDLRIDPFFERMLAELAPNIDDVCIFPDGSVKPLDVDASTRPSKRARASAPNNDDDDDDGADDDDDAFFARLKQQIEKPTDVIDLT